MEELEEEIWKEFGENFYSDYGIVATNFTKHIAQEFALYCMDELGYDQSTIIDEQFNEFLKQKYK